MGVSGVLQYFIQIWFETESNYICGFTFESSQNMRDNSDNGILQQKTRNGLIAGSESVAFEWLAWKIYQELEPA